jgi:hypothetical protein
MAERELERQKELAVGTPVRLVNTATQKVCYVMGMIELNVLYNILRAGPSHGTLHVCSAL